MKNILFALLILTACNAKPQVLINQLGHYPDREKIAVTEGTFSGMFRVVDEQTGETVYENTAGETVASPFSGKMLTKLDFTPFNKPGAYRIVTENGDSSPVSVLMKMYWHHWQQVPWKHLRCSDPNRAIPIPR